MVANWWRMPLVCDVRTVSYTSVGTTFTELADSVLIVLVHIPYAPPQCLGERGPVREFISGQGTYFESSVLAAGAGGRRN